MKRFFTAISAAASLLALTAHAQDFRYNKAGDLTNVQASASSAVPTIVTQPLSASVESGRTHSLTVIAVGPGTLNYTWFKDGQSLAGKTNSTLLFPAFSSLDAGTYHVSVSNGNGSVQSASATLSVPVNPFSAAIGSTAADWYFAGTYPWKVITNAANTHDGSLSIGTEDTRESQSFFEGTVTVTQMTTLRFWLRAMSSWNGGATVTFRINDHIKPISGYHYEWAEHVFHLPPGTYKLNWEHTGGGSVYLDDVSLTAAPDTDNDGLSDDFESGFFGNLNATATADPDYDRNSNLVEYMDITDPTRYDSLFLHLFHYVQGPGSVEVNPTEPPHGYEYQSSVTCTPVAASNAVFVGWSGIVSNSFAPAALTFYSSASMIITGLFSPVFSLEEALDAPSLTFTTGGTYPFIAQTNFTADGSDAVRLGPLHTSYETNDSWLETTITGPATVRFDAHSSAGGYTSYFNFDVWINGVRSHTASASPYWYENIFFLPSGVHTVRWLHRQHGTSPASWSIVTIDRLRVTPAADTDGDGLNDDWEMYYFYNLSRDGTGDYDGDRVSDLTEYLEATQPNNDYSLRVKLYPSVTGSGSIEIAPSKPTYDPGEYVTFTAVPAPGWALESWSGMTNYYDGPRYAQSVVFPIAANRPLDITANFVPETNLGEALDYTNFIWSSTFPRWIVSTNSHDGMDAVQTPPTLPYGVYQSTLSALVEGPKILSFWWKTDTRPDSQLAFESVGLTFTNSFTNSGFVDWERRFVQLPPGTNLVSWVYRDTSFASTGSVGRIDQVLLAVDSDEDGLADDWEQQYFGSLAQTGSGDADSDQVNNQNEWADGTNPTNGTSVVYRLVVLRDDQESVQVTPSALTYAPGTQVTLTADAEAFTGWSGDATGTNNPLVVTMDSSKQIRANFNAISLGADNTHLNFMTGGDAPWTREDQTERYAVDYDVARSGLGLTNGQQSWTELTLAGPGKLSFNIWPRMVWGGGHVRWELDGVELERLDQYYYTPDRRHINILPGTHTFRWVFEQGSNPSEGTWLDDVDWLPLENLPLATALDNAKTWTTTTNAPWLGQTKVTHDGVDAAATADIDHNQETYLETTLNNNNATRVTFWWKVSSEWGSDKLKFLLDGAELPEVSSIAGDIDWTRVSITVPAGPHTLRWVYAKDYSYTGGQDKGWVDEVSFQQITTFPLATALDTTNLTWTTSTLGAWTGNNLDSHDGVDAAASGRISDSQTNWLRTTVTGPGTLSYWWKVSSERGWDRLSIHMDASPIWSVSPISGEEDWTQVTVSIPTGSHNIVWYYTKDSSSYSGEDMGWVDQVSFTPSNVISVPQFKLTQSVSPAHSGWVYAYPYSSDGYYDSNTLVTVSAYPQSGKAFAGWSGASLSRSNSVTIRMNSNKSLVANFTNLPPSYLLTTSVTPVGGGYVTVNPYSADDMYVSNTIVTATATANPGFRFLHWTGASTSTNAQLTLAMRRSRTLNAVFTNLPVYTLTATTAPADAAEIVATPYSADNTYYAGTIVSLTATNEGTNVFSAWFGAVNSLTNDINVVMNGNKSVTALYNNPGTFVTQRTNGVLAIWFMQSTQRIASVAMNNGLKVASAWAFIGAADFDQDSHKDYLFTANGQTAIWRMDRNFITNKVSVRSGFTMPSQWRLVGAGDFTLDLQPDLLWHNTNGNLQVWTMNGLTFSSAALLTNKANIGWKALAVADFNGDNSADIVFQNPKMQIALWLMNGPQRTTSTFVNAGTAPPLAWTFRSVGDLDEDGQPDLIFQRPDGSLTAWLMNGPTFKGSMSLPATAAPGWILRAVK